MADGCGERALITGALSRFQWRIRRFLCALLLLACCGPGLAPAALCGLDRADETARVAAVHDGDTLRLNDGRRLRLIGLDTPELAGHGQAAQPLAITARDVLRQRLPPGATLNLRYDTERADAHGRVLAHGFFADGGSISAWLLEQGLATWLVLPPDRAYAECYAAAERRARRQRRGLWALPAYQPVAAARLPRDARAYHVVRGVVRQVRMGRDALWLQLDAKVAVRISDDDLPYFRAVPLRDLARREVVVRGWVYAVGDELHIKLHHPANLDWRADE